MRRWNGLLIGLLIVIFAMSGCTTKVQPMEQFNMDMDYYYGTSENNVFTNDFVNISIDTPEDWHVIEDQMKQQMLLMAEQVLGEDPEAYENIKLEDVRVYNLLFLFKYPVETQDKFNPSLLTIVERLPEEGIESEEAYLNASKELMSTNDLPMGFEYAFEETYNKEVISGKEFTVMQVALKTSVTDLNQKFFVHKLDDKVLSFIISYSTEAEEEELMNIIKTLTFK